MVIVELQRHRVDKYPSRLPIGTVLLCQWCRLSCPHFLVLSLLYGHGHTQCHYHVLFSDLLEAKDDDCLLVVEISPVLDIPKESPSTSQAIRKPLNSSKVYQWSIAGTRVSALIYYWAGQVDRDRPDPENTGPITLSAKQTHILFNRHSGGAYISARTSTDFQFIVF